MSTVHYAALLAIILTIHSCSANPGGANPNGVGPGPGGFGFGFPFFPPPSGNPCQENITCGRGTCVASNDTGFGFSCECEAGWRQFRADDDHKLTFLPCVIPNCTLNNNCGIAPPPTATDSKANLSFFDPCFWTECGGGTCNKTDLFTHTCICNEGYNNLFNTSLFPCYNECAFGVDCVDIGLNFTNATTSRQGSSSNTASDINSQTRLIPKIEHAWFITMVTTLALVVRMNT